MRGYTEGDEKAVVKLGLNWYFLAWTLPSSSSSSSLKPSFDQ